jgi:hypothetical protein
MTVSRACETKACGNSVSVSCPARFRPGLCDPCCRAAVFDHYGWACACCGATENLTIDHVNGGGRAHRLTLFGNAEQGGTHFWRWLADQGFPEGFQTLCMPCNSSKRDTARCRLEHAA